MVEAEKTKPVGATPVKRAQPKCQKVKSYSGSPLTTEQGKLLQHLNEMVRAKCEHPLARFAAARLAFTSGIF
jgi:hypothetical protein